MRRRIQLAAGSYVLTVAAALAFGFGATQALAGPPGPASARTCNINFCDDFCGAGRGICHHLTGECICG